MAAVYHNSCTSHFRAVSPCVDPLYCGTALYGDSLGSTFNVAAVVWRGTVLQWDSYRRHKMEIKRFCTHSKHQPSLRLGHLLQDRFRIRA